MQLKCTPRQNRKIRILRAAARAHPHQVAGRHAACAGPRVCRARHDLEIWHPCRPVTSSGARKSRYRDFAATASGHPRHAAARHVVCTCSRVHRSRDDVRTTQTCAQPGRSQLRKITFLSRVGPEHGSGQVLESAENRPRRIGCVLGSRAPSRTCIVRRCVMKICPSQALTSSGCTAREHKTRKAHLTGSWVRMRLGHTWSKARWCLPIFPAPEAGVVVRTRFVQS